MRSKQTKSLLRAATGAVMAGELSRWVVNGAEAATIVGSNNTPGLTNALVEVGTIAYVGRGDDSGLPIIDLTPELVPGPGNPAAGATPAAGFLRG